MRAPALLALVLLLASGAHALPAAWTFERTCGGQAPETSDCSTGTHTPILPELVVAAGADFTGEVTSRLAGEGWQMEVSCEYEGGAMLGCSSHEAGGLGSLVRVEGRHTCAARALEGGSAAAGRWSCAIRDVA